MTPRRITHAIAKALVGALTLVVAGLGSTAAWSAEDPTIVVCRPADHPTGWVALDSYRAGLTDLDCVDTGTPAVYPGLPEHELERWAELLPDPVAEEAARVIIFPGGLVQCTDELGNRFTTSVGDGDAELTGCIELNVPNPGPNESTRAGHPELFEAATVDDPAPAFTVDAPEDVPGVPYFELDLDDAVDLAGGAHRLGLR